MVGPTVALLLSIGVGILFIVRRKPDRSHPKRAARRAGGSIPAMRSLTLQSIRYAGTFSRPGMGTLGTGRQRSQTLNVVVNKAFSIPFDDDGDGAYDEKAVVNAAAAAAAVGYVLIVTDDAGESTEVHTDDANDELPTLPDYVSGDPFDEDEAAAHFYQNEQTDDPPSGGHRSRSHSYENAPTLTLRRDDAAHFYQNEDAAVTLPDEDLHNGRHSYENTTLRRDVDIRSGDTRTASTSSTVRKGYRAHSADHKTLRRGADVIDGSRSASKSSKTLRKCADDTTLRKHGHRSRGIETLRKAPNTADTTAATTYSDGLPALQSYGIPDPLPEQEQDLETYEVVEVRRHPGMRAKPDLGHDQDQDQNQEQELELELESYDALEVHQDGGSGEQPYSAIARNAEIYGGEDGVYASSEI